MFTTAQNDMIVNDKIFDFIYTIAMRDATLQKAYELKKDGLTDEQKKSNEYKKELLLKNEAAKSIVRGYIDDIIAGNNPCFYAVEEKLERSFDEFVEEHKLYLTKFTFGNCQKLINMTVKYFYIVTYSDPTIPTIRSHFNDCHCPMDNVMIKAIKNELKKDNKSLKDFGVKNDDLKSWSKIVNSNTSQYDAFQEIVKYLAQKQGVSPIEYDYLMWK